MDKQTATKVHHHDHILKYCLAHSGLRSTPEHGWSCAIEWQCELCVMEAKVGCLWFSPASNVHHYFRDSVLRSWNTCWNWQLLDNDWRWQSHGCSVKHFGLFPFSSSMIAICDACVLCMWCLLQWAFVYKSIIDHECVNSAHEEISIMTFVLFCFPSSVLSVMVGSICVAKRLWTSFALSLLLLRSRV